MVTLLQLAAEAQDLEDDHTIQLTRETGSLTLSLEDWGMGKGGGWTDGTGDGEGGWDRMGGTHTFSLHHTSAVASITELRTQDLPRQELGPQSMQKLRQPIESRETGQVLIVLY